MGRLKALGASDVPTPSRVQPTRPRTSSVRYDPSEISAAPRQAHLPHKSRVEPGSQPKRRPQSQPKPKPAARKTVKGRVGLTDDATSTARGGNVTLRAKVLAAVLRLSRERRKGKEGVGHSSVNLYLAQHAPEGTAPDSSSFAARILKTKQELIGEGVIAPGESKGRTLAVVPEVVKSVKQLCDVSNPDSSDDERACTAFLSSSSADRVTKTAAPSKPSRRSSRESKSKVGVDAASSSPSTRPTATAASKKRRVSTSAAEDVSGSDLSDLSTSDDAATRPRLRLRERKTQASRSRGTKKVKIIDPRGDGGTTDEDETDELASDADGERDAESSRAQRAKKPGNKRGNVGARGGLANFTKLQLRAKVEELRAASNAHAQEMEDLRTQLAEMSEVNQVWEARARVLGYRDDDEDDEDEAGQEEDQKAINPEPEAGHDQEQDQEQGGPQQLAGDVFVEVLADTDIDAEGENDVNVGVEAAPDKGKRKAASPVVEPPVTPDVGALALGHGVDGDEPFSVDDLDFDAELQRAGWTAPSVPEASMANSADSTAAAISSAPKPFAGAPLPEKAEPLKRDTSAPPHRSSTATLASADAQVNVVTQQGAVTTMTVLTGTAPHSFSRTTSAGSAADGETSLTAHRRASYPSGSSQSTASLTPSTSQGEIISRLGLRDSGAAAQSSPARQAQTTPVRGGAGGAHPEIRLADLENELDEADERVGELERELEKEREKGLALREDLDGVLRRHHETIAELASQKLQLEATVLALKHKRAAESAAATARLLSHVEPISTPAIVSRAAQTDPFDATTAAECSTVREAALAEAEQGLSELESKMVKVAATQESLAASNRAIDEKAMDALRRLGETNTLLAQERRERDEERKRTEAVMQRVAGTLKDLGKKLRERADDVQRLEAERDAQASLLKFCLDAANDLLAAQLTRSSLQSIEPQTDLSQALHLIADRTALLKSKLGATQAWFEYASREVRQRSTTIKSVTVALVGFEAALTGALGATSPGSTGSEAGQPSLHAVLDRVQGLVIEAARQLGAVQQKRAETKAEVAAARAALGEMRKDSEAQSQTRLDNEAQASLAAAVAERDLLAIRVEKLECTIGAALAVLERRPHAPSPSAASGHEESPAE